HWRTMEFRKRVPNIEASLCLFEYIHQFEYLCLVKKRDAPAHLALQRIQNQLVNAVKNQNFEVGFSIGAVTFVHFPDTTSKMLEQVDSLMYQVKNHGKSGLKHKCYAESKES
ncbi:MAG: hypothetical protein ACFCU7_13785, partial [Pleurocapsa sp.]